MRKVILLVVVAFVVGCSVSLFFGIRRSIEAGRVKRQQSDAEDQAVHDIRTIYHAQRVFYANDQFLGFTCKLSTLVAKPDALLDEKFASGHADGYTFTLSDCKHEENVGFNGNLTYRLTATPEPGSSALPLRTFCTDDDVDSITRGVVVYDSPQILTSAPGSSTCDQSLAGKTIP